MSFVRRSLGLRPATVEDAKLALNITAYNDLLELIEGDPPAITGDATKIQAPYTMLNRNLAQIEGIGTVQLTLKASGKEAETGWTTITVVEYTVEAGVSRVVMAGGGGGSKSAIQARCQKNGGVVGSFSDCKVNDEGGSGCWADIAVTEGDVVRIRVQSFSGCDGMGGGGAIYAVSFG